MCTLWSTRFRVDVWWFFQTVPTPSKRKQMSSSTAGVNLTPNKKLKALQAEDGSCRRVLRLRPQTPTKTDEVRTSPRKSSHPPTTPARQTRVAPGSKDSPVQPIRGGGARVIQEVRHAAETQRKAQVMPTKTIKSYYSYLYIKQCSADLLDSLSGSGVSEACPRLAVSQ